MRFCVAMMCAICAISTVNGQSIKAVVTGKLTTSDGLGVVGLVMLASTSIPYHQRILAAGDGSFRFSDVPAGRYVICAHIPQLYQREVDRPYVDSCVWREFAQTVAVSDGQQLAAVSLIATVAHVLRVRVDDPAGLLTRGNAVGRDMRDLVLTLRTEDSIGLPLFPASQDDKGRTYVASISPKRPVTLLAVSELTLEESGGAALVPERHFSSSGRLPVTDVVLRVRSKK